MLTCVCILGRFYIDQWFLSSLCAVQSAKRKKKKNQGSPHNREGYFVLSRCYCCCCAEIVCNFANSIVQGAWVEAISETFSSQDPHSKRSDFFSGISFSRLDNRERNLCTQADFSVDVYLVSSSSWVRGQNEWQKDCDVNGSPLLK